MESRLSSTVTTAPAGDEYLRKMAQIRDKLKKRFLRKPLYLEAAHSYEVLASRQLQLDFPEGAAIAWNAAGNVYTNIKRLGAAAENYTKAARAFMKEEMELKKLYMPSIEDYLINALECYHRAISTYEKMAAFNRGSTSVAGALCYEAGYKLNQLERFGESLWFLERAVHKWQSSIIFQVECLLLLAKSQVRLCEMEAAEATFHQLDALICSQVENASLEHIYLQVQISLVLLTALLGPPDHNLSPVQSALLERYKGEPDDHIEIEVFFTLKAILECCRERCFEKMPQHYNTLVEFCEETSKIILDELIATICPYNC